MLKTNFMEHKNGDWVILISDGPIADFRQKELVSWIRTMLESAARRQQNIMRKLFLRTLQDATEICMS